MAPRFLSRRREGLQSTQTTYIQPTQTTYTSDEVVIPQDFLRKPAADSKPIIAKQIDFAKSPVPEYAAAYAVVLDNVLSPSECAALLDIAEKSASTTGWKPAMLNVGQGREVMAQDVRNNSRIVYDSQDLVDRIWTRCCEARGLANALAKIEGNEELLGKSAAEAGQRWRFTRPNERMRFLRYGPGEYFKRHCDGSFVTPERDGEERSFYTLHLYLSDGEGLEGGATTFHPAMSAWSDDVEKQLRVESKLGRVLVFQQRNIVHSGEEVQRGLSKSNILAMVFIDRQRLESSFQA